MRNFVVASLVVTCLTGIAAAGEGLKVGEPVAAFYVKDVTGPSAGEKLCYRCRFGNRPVVSIFARDVDAKVASLIQGVDGVVGKNKDKDMAAFVVLLSDEPEAKESDLKTVAKSAKVEHTPLTTFDGVAGPAQYKIQEDAEITVMMWVDGKLKVNETLKKSDLTEAKIGSVVGKTSEILN